ncbi:MAG: GvpL/GvpF family gas vesicle protein [Candidatus Rokubacteria bacterium]|nr:GvpL/GvpF family gas vesicle protein [Candidatus Rokubacteria bacterium]
MTARASAAARRADTPTGARETATYLYCLVRSKTAPSSARAPRSIPGGGPVRVVPVGDSVWLVVSDAPLARYGDDAIHHAWQDLRWVSTVAMAHEAVVERFRSAAALLPVKLFTLFASDERAVMEMRRARRRLERLLDRVAGREEWGLRVLVDEAHAVARARRKAARPARLDSGTSFLLLKKAERDVKAHVRADAVRAANELYVRLVREADDARRRDLSGVESVTLLVDAAFLVRTSRARRFQATARRAAQRLAGEGYLVTLSGPWPAYSFVGARS